MFFFKKKNNISVLFCSVLQFVLFALPLLDTFVKAREAVPKFIEDSHHETDTEQRQIGGLRDRKRIRPPRLSSSESSEDDNLKVNTKKIPSPPPVLVTSKPSVKHVEKKKRLVDQAAESKKIKEQLLQRIKENREILAQRKQKQSPNMSGMTSPWKITNAPHNSPAQKNVISCYLSYLSSICIVTSIYTFCLLPFAGKCIINSK